MTPLDVPDPMPIREQVKRWVERWRRRGLTVAEIEKRARELAIKIAEDMFRGDDPASGAEAIDALRAEVDALHATTVTP